MLRICYFIPRKIKKNQNCARSIAIHPTLYANVLINRGLCLGHLIPATNPFEISGKAHSLARLHQEGSSLASLHLAFAIAVV